MEAYTKALAAFSLRATTLSSRIYCIHLPREQANLLVHSLCTGKCEFGGPFPPSSHANEATNVSVDGRIIYTMVVTGITIVYSILVFAPFDVLFMSFPFDFALFIMWLVAFCLLETARTFCRSLVDRNSIILGHDGEPEAISAVQGGTKTTGAIIGDAPGGLGRWARSTSMEPDGIHVFADYMEVTETVSSAKYNYPANGQDRDVLSISLSITSASNRYVKSRLVRSLQAYVCVSGYFPTQTCSSDKE
ncbi:hypothetical protein LCI18_012841 [Fusarium solani-melongenae]|uniref:Uncharacterized protein n=1 Tax=Fusarium solani subsp. cucurbitae TaxID=2747967 RepID=A0ACD3ZL27_FUSSC|nr:hypothetical protein LCI18_012841 [Fusarium solani-melongenae]